MKNIKLHPLVAATSVFVIGLVTAWAGYVLAKPSIELLNHGVRTEAEVVELVIVNDSDFGGYSPVVAFVDDMGQDRRIQCRVASGQPTWQIGETVDVIYPVNRPEDVQTTGWWDLWGAAMIPFIASVVFFMIAIGMLLKWIWHRGARLTEAA